MLFSQMHLKNMRVLGLLCFGDCGAVKNRHVTGSVYLATMKFQTIFF